MKNYLLTALVALGCGFLGAGLWQVSGLPDRATRAYLVENPEILKDMSEAYQRKEAAKRLAGIADQVARPFPGAVLGNPSGKRVLVEFSDYACGYCRASVAEVDRLIAADPELKVVIREWPIFEGSDAYARMALAAARQGKFAAFHRAMYEQGPPSARTLEAAIVRAGLDVPAARAFAVSQEATRELAANNAMANQLAFSGTPAWVAGGEVIAGAVGADRLREALTKADPG